MIWPLGGGSSHDNKISQRCSVNPHTKDLSAFPCQQPHRFLAQHRELHIAAKLKLRVRKLDGERLFYLNQQRHELDYHHAIGGKFIHPVETIIAA